MKKNKAFTLIELIAVLVIMAIIALIVTPLVMSIIKKVRTSADKRSIDAYGRSIELAIAGYLLDNGQFPTSIGELTIEYSGDEVVCSTTQLNSDASIYLADCTVGGRSVEGYTYGQSGEETPSESYTAYSVGDEVTYNNVNYYVIKDSSASEESVTLLKAEPLTIEEVNNYASNYSLEPYNVSGYGGLAFATGDEKLYANSNVKKIVDDWSKDISLGDDLVVDNLGYEARLLTLEELVNNLGYIIGSQCNTSNDKNKNVPSWVYNSNYEYWTMSNFTYCSDLTDLNDILIWTVSSSGQLNTNGNYYSYVIRPVITLFKSADIALVNS